MTASIFIQRAIYITSYSNLDSLKPTHSTADARLVKSPRAVNMMRTKACFAEAQSSITGNVLSRCVGMASPRSRHV